MPYIEQQCMKDFITGLKSAGHLSDSDIKEIENAMVYFFGYKKKKVN